MALRNQIIVLLYVNLQCSFYFNTCGYVYAGATNKPQELDDAVLRRLVSILVH